MKPIHPIIPRPAATVMLIRPQGADFQVYLLKRNEKSGFMGGYYVFPGGVLESGDRDRSWRRHVDSDPGAIMERLGGGIAYEEVLAYGVAAVRETYEEAGVLLARPDTNAGAIGSRDRPSDLPEGWLRQMIVSEGRLLAFSRLHRWAHWITPQRMKRRYDTRFFLTVVSETQECRPDRREAVHGIWLRPREGLAANTAGKIPLSPPTLISLHQLSHFRQMAELEDALQSRSWGAPLYPRLIPLQNGAVIIEPWDPAYRWEVVPLDEAALEKALLPIDAPFSRIWLREGLWRPIACV